MKNSSVQRATRESSADPGRAMPLGAPRALRAVPVLLTLHNLEEVLLMRTALPVVQERLPASVARVLPEIRDTQFLVAVAVVTLLPYLIGAFGDLERRGSLAVYLMLGVQAVVALNALSHLGGAILVGGYVPGLATAVLINAPASVLLFRRAAGEEWISRNGFYSLLPLAVLLHGPGLLFLMGIAGWVT